MKTLLDNTVLIHDVDLGQRLVCGEDLRSKNLGDCAAWSQVSAIS